jgi:hypothetical protein
VGEQRGPARVAALAQVFHAHLSAQRIDALADVPDGLQLNVNQGSHRLGDLLVDERALLSRVRT